MEISLKFILRYLPSVCKASEKKAGLVAMIPSQRGGRKFGNTSLESCSQVVEETRKIQDTVQFSGN